MDQIPVLLVCLGMILETYVITLYYNGKYRKSIFSGKRLKEAKEKIMGSKDTEGKPYFGAMGYPDFGNGRLSDTLEYSEWYKLNAAIRNQQNMFEIIGPAVFSTFALGLFAPKIAFLSGV